MKDPRAKSTVQVATGGEPHVETVRPPFDPEEFARQSETAIPVEGEPPSKRPTAPPPVDLPQYAPGSTSGTMQSLGAMAVRAVPALAVAQEDLEWFELPTLARELLALIDGHTPLAALCARAGLPLDRAFAACQDLARDGIITLRT